MSKRILIAVVPLILIGVALQALALHFYWYWTIWWFDVVMHVLGGVGVGLGIGWFLFALSAHRQNHSYTKVVLFSLIVFGTLGIGISWEVFEYLTGLFIEGRMFPDSIHDMFADLAGALMAYTYIVTRIQDTEN